MHSLFWKQMLHTKRLAVISALLTKPVVTLSRKYASVGLNTNILGINVNISSQNPSLPSFSRLFCTSETEFLPYKPSTNLIEPSNTVIMAPKGKKEKAATSAKPPKAESEAKPEKKGKASKKGSGEEKTPSRSSKRNVDKVAVSYKEVAENVDEKASESSRPKAKVAVKSKKAKYTVDSGSDVSESSEEEADSEDEKRKKKKRTAPKPRSAAEKKETTPAVKKAPKTDDAESTPPPAKKAKTDDAEPMNKTETDFEAIDFKSEKTTTDGKLWNLKISSWNICGLKAWMKKGALDFIKHEDPDIFTMQETRCSESKLPPGTKVDGYHTYWLSGEKEGYAGVGLYTKTKPLEVKYGLDKAEHDTEGRLITAEYDKFYLVCAYVPNAGRGLVTLPKRLKWDPDLRSYIKELDDKKPVILCGDLNVSHQAIDLANPKTNTKSAGFTQEERDGMSELLKEGFVDSFRHLNADKEGAYSYWTYMGNARSRNVGWRLDYFILSEKLVPNLCDSVIRSEVYGSDHCPITLLLNV